MIWLKSLIGPGRDFEQFQDKIVIVDSQMHFGATTNGNYVSAIGQIRNDSPYGWKELQLEVRYYNKEGQMIDTRTEARFGDTLPTGATHAFRVRGPADKPESQYASHKIFVRSAKDARRWP